VARAAALTLPVLAVAWVGLILIAPLSLAHGAIVLPSIVYEIGGLICHQRPERSFHLAGVQLPVCARCFGLYASAAAGAVAAVLTSAGHGALDRRLAVILAVAALPTAASVAVEWAGLAYPVGAARAMFAVPLGFAAAWLFVRALRASPSDRRLGRMRYHS
jgi:hypothetical protein